MCIRDRVYGVDVEDARQIPLKKYIEGCLNGEEDHDINQYAETNKQFDTVLDDVIQCMDNALIDKIIHCLHKFCLLYTSASPCAMTRRIRSGYCVR